MPKIVNRIVKSISPKSVFDDMSALVDTTITFNQGDFLVLDTSAHLIKAVSGTGELGTNFLGISRVSISSGVPLSPVQGTDVDAAAGIAALAGPEYGVTVKAVLKTSDAANPGDKVYLDAGSGTHHVTTTAGSKKPIGVYVGPLVSSAAAGQEIEILIGAQYPNDVCTF